MWIPSHNFLFRLSLKMKVMLDVFALCESASDLVNATCLEKYQKNRNQGHLDTSSKKSKIINAIMAQPKKFFNLSMEMLLNLSGLTKVQLRNKIALAVGTLTKKRNKNVLQSLVFEINDERILRG